MNYTIKLIQEKEDWENFLKTQDPNIFVQSWHYGEFFKTMNEEFFVIGIEKNGQIIGGALAGTTSARRGKFLYLPYGPKLDFSDKALFDEFSFFLKNLAEDVKADFIRVSPFIDNNESHAALFKEAGYRPAPMHILAENTWILDLSHSEEEILAAMRKTTRNLIRRGERDGVEIKTFETAEALDRIINLLNETAKRHHFVPFSEKYIKGEFEAFKGDALVYEAYYEGELASSAVIMFYGDTAVYRHGASSSTRIKCQPSYLLQWEAIKEAKRRGLKYYNFWGVAPEGSSKKHPFSGITTFKTGFGGEQKDLLHCQDLPITKKYWLNWAVETWRRIRRGF